MKKAYRALRWLAINGLMAWALYAGWVQEVDGAKNAVIFVIWFCFVISFAFHTESMKKFAKKEGRSVPALVGGMYDVATVVFLAWMGAWVLAVVTTVTCVNHACAYAEED